MVTQQRRDLLMNIPALRKLDAMLIVRTRIYFITLVGWVILLGPENFLFSHFDP